MATQFEGDKRSKSTSHRGTRAAAANVGSARSDRHTSAAAYAVIRHDRVPRHVAAARAQRIAHTP
jgi:hypothetical protein